MANYSTGTVSIAEGSNVIQGQGTNWLANLVPGQVFLITGLNRAYQIASVDSDTQITLTRPVVIIGGAGGLDLIEQSYTAVDAFTPNLSIPLLSSGDIDKQRRTVRTIGVIDQALGIVQGWQKSNGYGTDDDQSALIYIL